MTFDVSRLTSHVSRLTFDVSPFTSHASLFRQLNRRTHERSRLSANAGIVRVRWPAWCVPAGDDHRYLDLRQRYQSRLPYYASRITHYALRFAPASTFEQAHERYPLMDKVTLVPHHQLRVPLLCDGFHNVDWSGDSCHNIAKKSYYDVDGKSFPNHRRQPTWHWIARNLIRFSPP